MSVTVPYTAILNMLRAIRNLKLLQTTPSTVIRIMRIAELEDFTGGWISRDAVGIDEFGGYAYVDPNIVAHPTMRANDDRFIFSDGQALHVTGTTTELAADEYRPVPTRDLAAGCQTYVAADINTTKLEGFRMFDDNDKPVMPGSSWLGLQAVIGGTVGSNYLRLYPGYCGGNPK